VKNSFFVIQQGASQHIVSSGDEIVVDHIEGNVGDKVAIDYVLLVQNDDATELGSPLLPYSVSAEIVKQSMSRKVDVFKYKAKARYRKTHGHRQFQTTLKILKLNPKKDEKSTAEKDKPVTTKVPRKAVRKPPTTKTKTSRK
jgi:large subunit ribosomal protein L21